MKKFSKVMCLVLAVAMAFCFAACGSKDGGDGGDNANELYIGGIGPLSGDYANYGTSVKNGCELAVKEINAAGGINGMQVTLDFQDSQGDPDSAVSAYGLLMDNGMDVSLGGVLSGETASIVAAAKADGLLVLTPSGSAKDCINGNDSAFRVCFNDPGQGTASAEFIGSHDLPKKVAIFYQSDIDYSVGLYENFIENAGANGIEVVETQTFTNSTNTDFSTQINAIQSSGAELVFIPIYAAEASTFLTQASGKLDGAIFFGCDGLDGILTKVSDTAYAENVMMLTPFAADSDDEQVQKFVSDYEAAYGATPDQFAADGYDAIYAIKAAVEKAGKTPADSDFNEAVVAAMTEIEVDGVTGDMTWSADGETNKAAQAMIIHDGVATAYTE
jgi:branched-chain amino acid transport system substrate-binding protein